MIIDGPVILLQSGNYFNFLDPEGSSFTIEDVAHGLSMTCRFGGHCKRFYSVAEHCVFASRVSCFPRFSMTRYAPFEALMHDAAEAFIGDIPRPLKALLPDYQRIEREIETAMFSRFGVRMPLPAAVKSIDLAMLATEQQQIMENNDDWGPIRGVDHLPINLPCWTPQEAKAQFLQRFEELSKRRIAA